MWLGCGVPLVHDHLTKLEEPMVQITHQTLKALNELDETSRAAVDKIVRAHVRACRSNGFAPENLERVYIEAMEIVRLEGPPKEEAYEQLEPSRRYEQYRSPRAA
jgi:hypothetical protein